MADNDVLSISTLENWLWEAACVIRGPLDVPKFKEYILPLIFLKRLSDVPGAELGAVARPPASQLGAGMAHHDRYLVRLDLSYNGRGQATQASTVSARECPTQSVQTVTRQWAAER